MESYTDFEICIAMAIVFLRVRHHPRTRHLSLSSGYYSHLSFRLKEEIVVPTKKTERKDGMRREKEKEKGKSKNEFRDDKTENSNEKQVQEH